MVVKILIQWYITYALLVKIQVGSVHIYNWHKKIKNKTEQKSPP